MRSMATAIEESLAQAEAQLLGALHLPAPTWSGGSRQLFEDRCAQVLAGVAAARASAQQLQAAEVTLEVANAEVCAALTGACGA
ncbi:MAG: hypothetical protein Q3999_07510 [Buchananella hordeovulneris]|nr:hypothetical protein [Buchananella hordeovulneris]